MSTLRGKVMLPKPEKLQVQGKKKPAEKKPYAGMGIPDLLGSIQEQREN